MISIKKLLNFSTKRCLASNKSRMPLDERQQRLYPQVEQEFTDEGYPILKLMPSRKNVFEERPKLKRREQRFHLKHREEFMKEDQDWPSVWTTAKTFVPSAVPLPIRQSYEENANSPSRYKYYNTELLKISNFLHLTPVAIERHCKALKKFCTKWPDGLDTDEEVRSHFPITFIYADHVHALPTIRDTDTRTVTLRLNVDDLKLNHRDRDKLIRLATEKRYNKETGELTIVADACPMKIQNYNYANYLITALYFESLNHEDWEDEKAQEDDWTTEEDLEKYTTKVEKMLGLRRK